MALPIGWSSDAKKRIASKQFCHFPNLCHFDAKFEMTRELKSLAFSVLTLYPSGRILKRGNILGQNHSSKSVRIKGGGDRGVSAKKEGPPPPFRLGPG
jgi:hypothetical protein